MLHHDAGESRGPLCLEGKGTEAEVPASGGVIMGAGCEDAWRLFLINRQIRLTPLQRDARAPLTYVLEWSSSEFLLNERTPIFPI